MDREVRFKEAIKIALAFAIVYGIALKLSWMNPSWAGFGVAMIALPTAGQSIHKGIDRMAGTIPGCIGALVILALAPQNRWLFMFLAAGWIFFTVYMMIRSKNHPYFWNVAGFVCLVILLTGPASADSDFEHAVFRTLETALGISVYSLIALFVWPLNNVGAIKKAMGNLTNTQMARIDLYRSPDSSPKNGDDRDALYKENVEQLGQLSAALTAEGSENYAVHEIRQPIEEFHKLSAALMSSQDRLESSAYEIGEADVIDVSALMPGLQNFLTQLSERFMLIRQLLVAGEAVKEPGLIDLIVDQSAIRNLSGLQHAAFDVMRKELENVNSLSMAMLNCAKDIAGGQVKSTMNSVPDASGKNRSMWLPVPDRDHLEGALFAASVLIGGFLVWILFDPPGHSAWYELPTILAMGVGVTQQSRQSILFMPLALTLTLALAVYVFILPHMSTFFGLGSVLFLSMFANGYFFTGLTRFAGMVAIINMISVQNQQTYNFAAQANSLIFTLMGVLFIFAMSYMIRTARPEKAVLKMMGRFFRSTGFLVSRSGLEMNENASLFGQWRMAYHRNEMQSLPDKINAWAKTIDHKLFPGNTPEQVESLVVSLQSLAFRVANMLDSKKSAATIPIEAGELHADVQTWRTGMQKILERWSIEPGEQADEKRISTAKIWQLNFDEKADATIVASSKDISLEEGERLYQLMVGFRGVSQAALAYARVARNTNWEEWREERFS